jgi:hypothetical protein
MDFLDERGALVARFEGYDCAASGALTAAFRRNSVEPAAV